MFQKVKETANFIQAQLEGRAPKVGIVLGSGLGVFADKVKDKIEIPYSEIPNFHQPTVTGHKGRLVIGTVSGVEVAVFQGRFHYYEGHPLEDVVLPVRVLSQIGVEKLILTNAAGGISSDYSPGELVYITDHINLTGNSPLMGPNDERFGVRFPDMSEAYNKELNSLLLDSAKELDMVIKPGVYAGVLGPAYETPAEIRMLRTMGADMVGMSTVPESIAANHAGLKVCGISCITNLAAGISKEKLNHDDVKDVANMVMEKFTKLLDKAVEKIGNC
jgi:purine-nucleoside phosphorylase